MDWFVEALFGKKKKMNEHLLGPGSDEMDERLMNDEEYLGPGPDQADQMGVPAVTEKELRRQRQKERAAEIKAVARYYKIPYNVAQVKYYKMERDEIDKIVAAESSGEVANEQVCPRCGTLLEKKNGRLGLFWGCLNYPECRYTRGIESEVKKISEEKKSENMKKMELTHKFIDEIGGLDEARRWINVLATAMNEGG